MRSPTFHTALALLLAVVFVAPVAAVEPGGNDQETLTGTLEALWIESPQDADGHEQFDLRTSTGVVPLEFAAGDPHDLAGARVEVTGKRIGKTLHVADSTPGRGLKVRTAPPKADAGAWAALDGSGTESGTTGGGYATAAAVSKSFAVILLNFKNLATQPWTKTTVQNAVTGSSTSMKAYFEEQSKGRMTISASVFGWYTIDANTTGCDWRTWHTLASDKATAAGVNLSAYTNVIFIWPQTNECGFAGVAYVPGKHSYLNGTLSVQVMTHEVGHNFGLSHSNARNCVIGGSRTWLAETSACTTNVYADPFSTMGNNALRHNHGSHLGELGWLSASEKVVGTPGNTYTIAPYFGSGPVKLVRIPRGDGTFFDLDTRTPYGSFDNYTAGSPAVAGTTIRLGVGTASPTTSPRMTELLDTTPSTADLKDAPLLVGKTVTDPVSTISFKTLSVDPSGVTVQVREGIKPSTPGSFTAAATDAPRVDLAWAPATDNIAVASYTVTRNGTSVGTIPASATSWTDPGVAFETSYAYTVAAVDTSGNTGTAASRTVTTPPDPTPDPTPEPTPTPDPTTTPNPTPTPDPTAVPVPTPTPDPATAGDPGADTQAPTAPSPLNAVPTVTSISLTWGAASDDRGIAGYRISRSGSLVATVPADALEWQDRSRKPATYYTYGVVAVDAAGNRSPGTSIRIRTRADTVRPSTPKDFRRIARSGTYVTFAWSPSIDNVKVLKYRIYREGRTSALAATTGTKIRISTRYRAKYYVRAVDTSYNRSYQSVHVRGR